MIYHGAFAPRGCYHESTAVERNRHVDIKTAGPSGPLESTVNMPVTTAPADARTASAAPADTAEVVPGAAATNTAYTRPRHFAWADLLRRTFQIDILACECGGRLRLLATIEERAVVERILKHVRRKHLECGHLGLPLEAPSPSPDLRRGFGRQAARSPPWLPGFADTTPDE